MERYGYEIVFLLMGAVREVIEDLHRALETQGFAGISPMHGFALQAIGPDGASVSEMGRRLGVTKQAAGKTVRSLEEAGLVTRDTDPRDRRAVTVTWTARGEALLALSADHFELMKQHLVSELGAESVETMCRGLEALTGEAPVIDFASWISTVGASPAAE